MFVKFMQVPTNFPVHTLDLTPCMCARRVLQSQQRRAECVFAALFKALNFSA